MGVPKKHITKGSRNQRRMHLYLEEPGLTICVKCGKSAKRHTVCAHCGFYKGVEVINVLANLEKKERKQREREMKETKKAVSGEPRSGRDKKEEPLSMEELSKKKF